MLTIESGADGVLRIFADGQLTTDDYADFVGRFELLTQEGPIPMRIDLGPDFSGWSVARLWQVHKVSTVQTNLIGRIAVVGDPRWEEWGKELTGAPSPRKVQFFRRGREAAAEEWLLSERFT